VACVDAAGREWQSVVVPQLATISGDFAAFLQRERQRIVPFVGAGLSREAGVPAAGEMALLIIQSARERGAELIDDLGFDDACAAVTDQLTHKVLQEIVAGIVSQCEIVSTPVLELLVRCPSRIVITTNYDPALSVAASAIGLEPMIHHPRSAYALDQPPEGSVAIIHLHGSSSEPKTMALPGPSLEALEKDEPLKTVLRALVLPHVVVYLGYRLPAADEYLRKELEWLTIAFQDRGAHALLLPRDEYADRQSELTSLEAHAGVRIETFDSERGFRAVQHAALIIAPRAEPSTATDVQIVRDKDVDPYFYAPALLPAEESGNRDPATRIALARHGLGDPVVPPLELLNDRRALVVAGPGMGKTQLLYHLGRESREWVPLFLRLTFFASELRRSDGTIRAFARALRDARCFHPETRHPTPGALDSNAYFFLLDALDEVEGVDLEEVIAGLAELAERFPQHLFIVTSRPIPERPGLEGHGFRPYQIYVDETWGHEYLQARGIPKQRIDELYREMPTISSLLGIPLYAAFVGNRLRDEAQLPLPESALALITEIGVRDAVQREKARTGDNPDDLYRWLQTLAVCLEVRGRNQATVGELAAIPGPEALEAQRTREGLVLGALLKDQPDIAAFQTVTIQEGLAAEALLATDDPVATLRNVAVAEIAGRSALRSDIDHLLDLFFESADGDARAQLRALDEFRWARTQGIEIEESEALETLRSLWNHFIERRIWVERRGERQIRGAGAAIRRLAAAFPSAAEALRPEVVAATTAEESTARGDGLAFLQEFPPNIANVEIIRSRLQDEESVVRRAAAEAAEELGLTELCADLEYAYSRDTDQLALQTIGYALLGLTPEKKRARLARVLAEKTRAWDILDTYVVRALSLEELLDFFLERGFQRSGEKREFSDELKRRSRARWRARDVRQLVAIVIGNAGHYYVEPLDPELLSKLCARFPGAALEGARQGASSRTTWRDLLFLRGLERKKLKRAATGALQKALEDLLEFIDAEANRAEEPLPPQPSLPDEPKRRLSQWLKEGRLTETRCPDGHVIEELLRQVSELSKDEREHLAELAEAWWPEAPFTRVIKVEGGTTTAPAGLSCALAVSAALDLTLDSDRWLEIFGSRALRVHWDAADWLARRFPAERSHEIAVMASKITDALDLSLALRALPKLDEALADALAEVVLGVEISGDVLTRFREEGFLDRLRVVAKRARSDDLQRSARTELARIGDIDSQRAELRRMLDDIATDPRAYEHGGLQWASHATADVLPEIGDLLKAVARTFAPSESELGRTLTSALAATADERALDIYGELIEGDEYVDGSFYWYQREELARTLARRRVLERLPNQLEEVAHLLAAHGYQVS
jgi:hypothetical protein